MKGEVLGVPQIYAGRSQGRTPERNDFNLESEMIKNRGRGRRNSGNLQLSENVAHLVWLKIQMDGHASMRGGLSGQPEVKGREKLRMAQVYCLQLGGWWDCLVEKENCRRGRLGILDRMNLENLQVTHL